MTTDTNHTQLVHVPGGGTVTKDNIALYEVLHELQRIRARHGPLASNHEGLGVLLEEFEELKDEIKKNPREFHAYRMRAEAIQVAAVAVRICADLAHDESKQNPRGVFLRDQAVEQCDRMRDRWLQSDRERDDIQGSHDHCSELLNMFCEHFDLPIGAGDLGIRIEATVERNAKLKKAAESLLAELTAGALEQSEGSVNAAKELEKLL